MKLLAEIDNLILQATQERSHYYTAGVLVRCRQALTEATEALNRIASWDEGPQVRNSFDCPDDARIAREALARIGQPRP